MSAAGLLFAFVLASLTLLVILAPLLISQRRAGAEAALTELQRERLQVYYERVLRNIRDLDDDHAVGKVNPEDYAREREYWAVRGVQALKALDALAAQTPDKPVIARTTPDSGAVDHAIDDAIEAAVRAARQSQPSEAAPQESSAS
ncbi:hypothetical protein FBR02_12055 [Anaerolineae bacterium CFX9]|nr:hypothetical protein [Anaerolineae bacterium CFX9]